MKKDYQVCEMCGEQVKKRFEVEIEGSKMLVCSECAKHGSKVKNVAYKKSGVKRVVKHRPSSTVIKPNYGAVIKEKREKIGKSQADLSDELNIKESVLQKIENNKLRPDRKLVIKLQAKLQVNLFEKVTSNIDEYKKNSSKQEGLTLGDMIKFKKKK